MSTTNPFDALLQQLLGFLRADVLGTFGTPVLTFLEADAAAGGDIAKIVAAFVALQSSLAAAIPQNTPTYVAQIGQLNTALATLLATKLQAWLSAQQAQAAAK